MRSELVSDKDCDNVQGEDARAVVMVNAVSFVVEYIVPDNKQRNWNSPVVAGIHPVVDNRTIHCNLELDNQQHHRILEGVGNLVVVAVAGW